MKKVSKKINEVEGYIDGRYIGANQALWRISNSRLYGTNPNVYSLPYHLPGENYVYVNDAKESLSLEDVDNAKQLQFLEYFKNNEAELQNPLSDLERTDKYGTVHPNGYELKYMDYPKYYTWNSKGCKKWKRRYKGAKSQVVSKIYYTHPKNKELFYLRTLLLVQKGATCHEDLKIVNLNKRNDADVLLEKPCDSFYECCKRLNLLSNDKVWYETLMEARIFQLNEAFVNLSVYILCRCYPTDGNSLWRMFTEDLQEGLKYKLHVNLEENLNIEKMDLVQEFTLQQISNKITSYDEKFSNTYFGIPERINEVDMEVYFENEKENEFTKKHEELFKLNYSILQKNEEQKFIYNRVINALMSGHEHLLLFIDAPAGTGKTFLLNTILHKIRSIG